MENFFALILTLCLYVFVNLEQTATG